MSAKSKHRRLPSGTVRGGASPKGTGPVVRALKNAGLVIGAPRGFVGDVDALIMETVAPFLGLLGPANSGAHQQLARDEDPATVAHLVGSGLARRGGRKAELPWATAEEISRSIESTDTLSTSEVAARLNTTARTVIAWRKDGRLLGIHAANRHLRYPVEQLGPNRTLLPLQGIIQALNGDHWAAWRFLTGPVEEIGGRTGFELLRRGKLRELKSVLEGRAYGAFS